MAERIPKLTIENARLIFCNFTGTEKQFNPAGHRNFNVVIDDPNVAENLKNAGWRVKPMTQYNPGDPLTYQLQVAVRFDVIPPRIFMLTSQGKTQLTEDTVSLLDNAEIKCADMIIAPRVWDGGIKAYLDTMYVTIEENALDKKYNTYGGASEGGYVPF